MIIIGIVKLPKIVAYTAAKSFAEGQKIKEATKLIQDASVNDTKKLFEIKSILEQKPEITDSKNKKHISGDVLHSYLDKIENNKYEIFTQQQIYHLRNRADRILVTDGQSLGWELGNKAR